MISWGLLQLMRERIGTGRLEARPLRTRFGAAFALFVAIAAAPIVVTAAPLDPLACEQLQQKIDALRKVGIEADMVQGPAWARANLTAGRLQLISEYIEIDEQLNFRCGLAKQRIVLPTTVEGGEEEIPTPGEPAAAAATGVPLPQKAPPKGAAVPKKAAPAKAKEPKSAAPAPPKKAPAKSAETQKKAPEQKAVPKKRAKVEDAYRPPRASLGDDPAPPMAKQ
jgi:hypothetical protein